MAKSQDTVWHYVLLHLDNQVILICSCSNPLNKYQHPCVTPVQAGPSPYTIWQLSLKLGNVNREGEGRKEEKKKDKNFSSCWLLFFCGMLCVSSVGNPQSFISLKHMTLLTVPAWHLIKDVLRRAQLSLKVVCIQTLN